MRDLNVPVVRDSGRYFPAPVFVSMPKLERLDDGHADMWIESKQRWKRIHPLLVHLLDALNAGVAWDEVLATLPPAEGLRKKVRVKIARKSAWTLHQWGHLRIDLPPPPAKFNGRYRHVKELGRGGFGIAHHCHDEQEDRAVVVKHPWGVKHVISDGQKCLAREIHVLERFKGRGFPVMYEWFKDDNNLLHLAREHVDGVDLHHAYAGSRRPARAERLAVAEDIASILARFHEQDLLFTDGCPGNFMRKHDGEVLAIDFGSVRSLEGGRIPMRGNPGTPGYIATEILERDGSDTKFATARSDMFSFGRLMYFLVSGQAPHRKWRAAELNEDLAKRDVEPDERALIEACSADDPEARPKDMREVIAMIQALRAA